DMRATRDLLRRRLPRMRQRADLLAPIQNTHRQYHRPEMGKTSASKANRAGGAERCPEPAVQNRVAVALALMEHDAPRLRNVARSILHTAKPHNANPLSLLRTVPGIGAILSCVLLDAIHAIQRCPRGQDFVSSCRLVQCARASAGKRSGTS